MDFDGAYLNSTTLTEADTTGPARIVDGGLKPDPWLMEAPELHGPEVRDLMDVFALTAPELGFDKCTTPYALDKRLRAQVEGPAGLRSLAEEALQAACANGDSYEDLSRIGGRTASKIASIVASEVFDRARQAGLHERLSN